ncbi:unnamed protein product [Ixodes pacificus]
MLGCIVEKQQNRSGPHMVPQTKLHAIYIIIFCTKRLLFWSKHG